MIRVTISNMAWINMDDVSPEKLDILRRVLTIKQRATSIHSEPSVIITYVEDKRRNLFGVPLFFFLKTMPKKEELDLKIDVSYGDAIDGDMLGFKGELREGQIAPFNSFVSKIDRDDFYGGIISLPCGAGKTTIFLKAVSELKLKTLVIVHKEFLVNQWSNRIKEFLPRARIGRIQQDVCDVDDKEIVIGMIHSLASREYGEIYDRFGLVGVDECLAYDAKVMTNKGIEYIGKIVEKFENGETIDVLSFNEVSGKKEYMPVVNVYRKGIREVIEIEVEDGHIIRCTPEHMFFTLNRGWVEAINLNESDDIY